jgi:hypothetical protein
VDDHTVQQQKITVRLETIDQYAQLNNIDHIDILKLDVQGSELSVLKGAAHLLGNGKIGIVYAEIWFTAVYEAQPYFEDIALFLRQYQFRTHGIYDVHFDFLHDARHLWADALFVRPINLHNKSARSE